MRSELAFLVSTQKKATNEFMKYLFSIYSICMCFSDIGIKVWTCTILGVHFGHHVIHTNSLLSTFAGQAKKAVLTLLF